MVPAAPCGYYLGQLVLLQGQLELDLALVHLPELSFDSHYPVVSVLRSLRIRIACALHLDVGSSPVQTSPSVPIIHSALVPTSVFLLL